MSLNKNLILAMAEAGIHFIATDPGMTRSNVRDWQHSATTSKADIEAWLKQARSLVTVAKRGHNFAIDLDDPKACADLGLKEEWLKPYFRVKTPSGGVHCHGLAGEATDALPNIVNVHATKGDPHSQKILELKIHNGSVAAPGAERKGQKNKCDGTYEPLGDWQVPQRDISKEFLDWLKVRRRIY